MATIQKVRAKIKCAEIREDRPELWTASGTYGRTPAPGVKKALLWVARIDGKTQKWVFAEGAIYYEFGELAIEIIGGMYAPIPPI